MQYQVFTYFAGSVSPAPNNYIQEYKMTNNPYIYRLAEINEILPLRQQVIIAGTARASPEFPGDGNPDTYHFGAYLQDLNIGCLSWMASLWENAPAYQLRGMATHPDYQGRGVGKELLKYSESFLKNKGILQVWCTARLGAVPFYLKQGWKVVSDEFLVEGVGLHRKMVKSLYSSDE